MEQLVYDLRYALRGLRRSPAFTAIVILTLGLGIGVNTALFSVVQAVLLRALPYPEPDRLVRAWSAWPERGNRTGTVSPQDLEDWRRRNKAFEQLAAFPALGLSDRVLTGGEQPESLATSLVTEGFFETLGVRPLLGRTLQPQDQEEGRNRVVVLSHRFWQTRLGGDPAVVGTTLRLDGELYAVLGVMPSGFGFPDPAAEMWAPLSLIPESGVPRRRDVRWLSVIGRLKPGVTPQQAQAELTSLALALEQEYPDSNEGVRAATVSTLHAQMVGDVRPGLLGLFAAVGLVLLISCANVANLLLVRSEGRRREIAVRQALGAGRWDLGRQVLTESLVLALLGGAAGLVLAAWGGGAVLALAPGDIPRLHEAQLDPAVLAFTLGVSGLTGVLFGFAPLLRAGSLDLAGALKEEGLATTAGRGARRLRGALVVAQVALVAVLAVGAGLTLRSLARLQRVDPGFDPQGVLCLGVHAPDYKYPESEQIAALYEALRERLASVPGVLSVAAVRPLALGAGNFGGERIGLWPAGTPEPTADDMPTADLRFVTPGSFRTLGIPLLQGRDLGPQDRRDAPLAVVANASLARRFWPEGEAVGGRLRIGRGEALVVGVAGDVRQTRLDAEPFPAVYAAHAQATRRGMTVVVRTAVPPLDLLGALQRAVWEVDPDQPITDIASMQAVVADALGPPRFATQLLGFFAGLALVLAGIGIYGVLSYTVSQRTQEIGIRMALGAGRSEVLRLVVGQGLGLALSGVALGLIAAAGLSRWLASLLFEVRPLDPPTFAGVAVGLLGAAVLASLVPARRATRLDPVAALRHG
jgi:predicted permease